MASNKLRMVSICIVMFAVTFSMGLSGLGTRSTMSGRHNVTKPNVSTADPSARSTTTAINPFIKATMAITDPVTRSAVSVVDHVARATLAVTERTVRSTVGVTKPTVRSTVGIAEPTVRSTVGITEPTVRSTVGITEPVIRPTMTVTDHVTRSTMAVTKSVVGSTVAGGQPVSRSSIPVVSTASKTERAPHVSLTDVPGTAISVSPTDVPGRTFTVSLTDVPDRTSHVSLTDAADTTSHVSLTDVPDTTPYVSLTDAADTTSHVSLTDAPDTTSIMSLTDAADTTSHVSLTDAPDATPYVSLTDAPDTTSHVSLTDAPDTTSHVSLTDAPDTTSHVSLTNAPDTTSHVSLTDAPDTTSHVSLTDAPDTTFYVSLTDAPDRTSTLSLTDAPYRTSAVSLANAPDREPHVSLTDAADTTSLVSLTDVPDTTSHVSPTDAADRTFTMSPADAPDRTTTMSLTDAPDRTFTMSPTPHYVRTTLVPENTPGEWWVSIPTTTIAPVYQTTIGGNSLDRFLDIHGNHGSSCPFGQVYYYGNCHVTWPYTTPPPLASTQEYISTPNTAGTSVQPRSTTNPHVQPPPTSTHVQPSTDVQLPTRVLPTRETSTTRDSISSPSPTRDNDAIPINEHIPTTSPTTLNYTGGHTKHHNTTGKSEDKDLSASAVTTSTNTSPDHVQTNADTQLTTSSLQCTHIILDNSTFNMYPNGSVVLKGGKVINENDFILTPKGRLKVCVSALDSQGSNTKENFKIDRNRPTVVLTNICLVSSQVFLFLTFILHCFFSSLRNLPGVILMVLSISLFLAHGSFFFGSAQAYNRTTCIAIGVVIHFFWLASFCWLNISSFHTFRVFRDVFASRSFESNKKRIIFIYCVFGYGTPAVVVAATITSNYFVSGSESFGYADTSNFCFVSSGTNSIVGLLVPAGITILVSFALFILTVVYLCKASANRRKVGNGEKWNILMYIKLSSITGFSWVFGFLQMVDRSNQVFTYLFILLTGAQGVFIFMAFMANKRTFLLVKNACRKQNKEGKYSTNSSDTKSVPSDVENKLQRQTI